MNYKQPIRVVDLDLHRNGICGAPFHVVLFDDIGGENTGKVGILFDAPQHCAVLDVDKLARGSIAFGLNSYRGDVFEKSLRAALKVQQPTMKGNLPMDSDSPITNADRAERARKALEVYNDEYDTTANAIDLLTDLQH